MTTESTTLSLLRLALDAASMRHLAIADNIANAGSAGYVPQQVNFEQQLGFARQSLAAGLPLQAGSLDAVQPYLEPVPGAHLSSTATLDMEVARLSQNTLHYQSLLRALSRHTAILSTAINEGRR